VCNKVQDENPFCKLSSIDINIALYV
jgi:hypothetical protein